MLHIASSASRGPRPVCPIKARETAQPPPEHGRAYRVALRGLARGRAIVLQKPPRASRPTPVLSHKSAVSARRPCGPPRPYRDAENSARDLAHGRLDGRQDRLLLKLLAAQLLEHAEDGPTHFEPENSKASASGTSSSIIALALSPSSSALGISAAIENRSSSVSFMRPPPRGSAAAQARPPPSARPSGRPRRRSWSRSA